MKARVEFSEIPEGLMSCMTTIETYLSELDFEVKLLELIRLRVSYINGCTYCIAMHYKEALDEGETLHRLYSVPVWSDASCYTDRERACLQWAEYITLPQEFSNEQELFEKLSHYFDKAAIANLTLVIIQINAWNRLMKSFGIEADQY